MKKSDSSELPQAGTEAQRNSSALPPGDTLMVSAEYDIMFRLEADYFWYRALHDLTLAQIRKLAGTRPPAEVRIIDCGCGTGGMLAVLKPHFPSLTGFDYSPDAVRLCHQRGFTDVQRLSITETALPPETFDIACSLDVLYVFAPDEFRQALREIRRILKKDGALVFNLPAFEHLRSEHDEAVRTKQRFRRDTLRRELQAAGFEVELINYRVSVLFPLIWIVRMLKNLRKTPRHEAHSDLKPLFPPLNRFLTVLLKLENRIIPHVPMPFGLSVFGIARRRD